jgi:hypothetical protein
MVVQETPMVVATVEVEVEVHLPLVETVLVQLLVWVVQVLLVQ